MSEDGSDISNRESCFRSEGSSAEVELDKYSILKDRLEALEAPALRSILGSCLLRDSSFWKTLDAQVHKQEFAKLLVRCPLGVSPTFIEMVKENTQTILAFGAFVWAWGAWLTKPHNVSIFGSWDTRSLIQRCLRR